MLVVAEVGGCLDHSFSACIQYWASLRWGSYGGVYIGGGDWSPSQAYTSFSTKSLKFEYFGVIFRILHHHSISRLHIAHSLWHWNNEKKKKKKKDDTGNLGIYGNSVHPW